MILAQQAQLMLRFHSIKAVSLMLAVSEKTVQRFIDRGELPRHRMGGQVRISDHDLRAFVAMRRETR